MDIQDASILLFWTDYFVFNGQVVCRKYRGKYYLKGNFKRSVAAPEAFYTAAFEITIQQLWNKNYQQLWNKNYNLHLGQYVVACSNDLT